MNYTSNYQLPQWVESDRVLMNDFNDANSKLDAALTGLAGKSGWTQLGSYVATQASQSHTLLISGSQVAQHHLLLVYVDIPSGGAYVKFNSGGSRQVAGATNWISNGVLEILSGVPGWVIIPVAKKGNKYLRGISLGSNLFFVNCNVTASSLARVSLVSNYSGQDLATGTTIEVWGSY